MVSWILKFMNFHINVFYGTLGINSAVKLPSSILEINAQEAFIYGKIILEHTVLTQ